MRSASMAALGLIALIVWLRAPGIDHGPWNVDEAIHAAVAGELLNGGVLYRDSIDQRTPLSYYVVAATFALSSPNNLPAMHVLAAAWIMAAGFSIFLLGQHWRGAMAGFAAAALFAVISTVLPYAGDANAFHTEWMLVTFTSIGCLCAWRAWESHSSPLTWFSGGCFGLAFLSKQPALLDLAGPGFLLVFGGWQFGGFRSAIRQAAHFAGGFLIPLTVAATYFAFHGALRDAVLYSWTYNLSIYGPEISWIRRLLSVNAFGGALLREGSGFLIWLVAGGVLVLDRLRRRPNVEAVDVRAVVLIVWSFTSLSGALSGGRGFAHYFIQCYPPLCLLAGAALTHSVSFIFENRASTLRRTVIATVLLASIAQLGLASSRARVRTVAPDPTVPAAHHIRATTAPDDRIFVWGYQPEFYHFADRRPASRFVYASFLTGLVPWTNVAPGKDTSYAIVPGAMDTLLRELTSNPPAVIVDCSSGGGRHWSKYPLQKFPQLHAFVTRYYELDAAPPERLGGFALYRLRR